jgi:peptide/nickel transport system substrate-binding protein
VGAKPLHPVQNQKEHSSSRLFCINSVSLSIMLSFVMSSLRRWTSVLLASILAIALGLSCQLALAGCTFEQLKAKAAQAPSIVYSSISEPNSFNYILAEGNSSAFLNLIYEGLVSENGITGKLEPALAESWEISDDKKRIVFTLRQGLKWSDGAPLTSEDIVFTYNDIFFNEAIPTDYRDILKIGEQGLLPGVRKIDDRRVEFTVPEPFAPFLRYAGGIAVLPAHALRESVRTKDAQGNPKFLSMWGTNTNPQEIVGSGPYRLDSYITGQQVLLKRNPYYWKQDAQGNPQPYIERFIWAIVESTDTELLQFRSGSLDTIDISPEYFSLLKQQEKQGRYTVYIGGPTMTTTFLTFNLNQARNSKNQPLIDPIKSRWFNTLAFRQAIAHAINRPKMINNVYRGLGEPQNSTIYKQSPYYLSPKQGLKVYDYDPEQAKELLRGAGFKYNAQGQLLDADGNRVRFTAMTNAGNKLREAIASQIQQDLSKIGIQLDLSLLAFNTMLQKVYTTRQWDSYIGGIGGGGVEPNGGANTWLVKGGLHAFNLATQESEPPLSGWQAADWEYQIQQLYIQGAQELDEPKRKAIYAKAQQVIQEHLPFIYLVNPYDMTAIRDRIQGIRFSALGGALWNLTDLKVVEDE